MSRIPRCPATEEGCDRPDCRRDRCALEVQAAAERALKRAQSRASIDLNIRDFAFGFYDWQLPTKDGRWIVAEFDVAEALALHRTVEAAISHLRRKGDREFHEFAQYVRNGGRLPELDGISATIEGYRRAGADDYLTEARIIVRDRRPTGSVRAVPADATAAH